MISEQLVELLKQELVGQNFPREASILESLTDDLLQALVDTGAWIAGGAVTSVFTGKEVNDLDLYFPSAEAAAKFTAWCWSKEYGYCDFYFASEKCLSFKHRSGAGSIFQIIYYKYFESAEDIFKDFDFTVNMGAYHPASKKFILHEDFLRHNCQKVLQVNPNTAYPLISVLRTQKYKEKGYRISKPQMLRLLIAISQKNFTSWQELKEQLGGMYGQNIDTVFPEEKEFSLDLALECIDKLSPAAYDAQIGSSIPWEDLKNKVKGKFPESFQGVVESKWYKREGSVTIEEYLYGKTQSVTKMKPVMPADLDDLKF